MHLTRTAYTLLATVVIALGCGENLAPPYSGNFGPPKNLKALSVDSTTVRLQWSAADGSSDSTFGGYEVLYLGQTFATPKTILEWNARNLPSGLVAFSVRSRSTDGRTSDTVSISWAGANRYEGNYILTEFLAGDPSRQSGLDVGNGLAIPRVMGLQDVNAGQLVDVFLAGGGLIPPGQEAPLRLYSASIYAPAYPVAGFSSTTSSSPSLDYFLAAFPTSLDSLSVLLTDNTIYYVRVGGPNATVNVARLHVRLLGGSYPNRTVAINISLERIPNLLVAEAFGHRFTFFAMTPPGIAILR
jgi:hypothetical protein